MKSAKVQGGRTVKKRSAAWVRHAISIRSLSIILLLIASISTAYFSKEAFALDLMEADCRTCHCDVVDQHHLLLQTSGYECLNCHELISDGTDLQPQVVRDCLVCHGPSLADRHHLLAAAGTHECMGCHKVVLDEATQEYGIELNAVCAALADNTDQSNQPPLADAGPDQTVMLGVPVNFSGEASYDPDPDGNIQNFTWDFGDGESASGITTSHLYASPGIHVATLSVTDDRGAMDSDTAVITVGEILKGSWKHSVNSLDQAGWLTGLPNLADADTSSAGEQEITTNLKKDSTNDGFLLENNAGDHKVISVMLNEDPRRCLKVIIRLFVRDLYGGTPQNVRIYAYQNDGDNVEARSYMERSIDSSGWVDLDVSWLAPKMANFGWMKFRIACSSNSLKVTRANLVLEVLK